MEAASNRLRERSAENPGFTGAPFPRSPPFPSTSERSLSVPCQLLPVPPLCILRPLLCLQLDRIGGSEAGMGGRDSFIWVQA